MVSASLLLKLWKRRLSKTILVAITVSGKENVYDILSTMLIKFGRRTRSLQILLNSICKCKSINATLAQTGSSLDSSKELIKAFADISITLQTMSRNVEAQFENMQTQINTYQITLFNLNNQTKSHNSFESHDRSINISKSSHLSQRICF